MSEKSSLQVLRAPHSFLPNSGRSRLSRLSPSCRRTCYSDGQQVSSEFITCWGMSPTSFTHSSSQPSTSTINKQMLIKAFCSNVARSLSSGNHLFYKAEYMEQTRLNHVCDITFGWSALVTWKKFLTTFWKPFSGIPHLHTFAVTWHKAPGTWRFRSQVPAPSTWYITKTWQLVQKRAFKVQYRNAYFRSLVHSKFMAHTSFRRVRPMYSAW